MLPAKEWIKPDQNKKPCNPYLLNTEYCITFADHFEAL